MVVKVDEEYEVVFKSEVTARTTEIVIYEKYEIEVLIPDLMVRIVT